MKERVAKENLLQEELDILSVYNSNQTTPLDPLEIASALKQMAGGKPPYQRFTYVPAPIKRIWLHAALYLEKQQRKSPMCSKKK